MILYIYYVLNLFLKVNRAIVLEDELFKLVRFIIIETVASSESKGGFIIPVEDISECGGGLSGGHGDSGDMDRDSGDMDRDSRDRAEVVLWDYVIYVACLTNLLRDGLADSDGNSLVLQMTDFFGQLLALGDWFTLTGLVRDLVTLLSVNIVTLLLGNLVTHGIGNLLGMSLLNVVTFVIWILLTTAWNWSPDLLFANNLPVVFTVFLVAGDTLGLSVGLHHCLVLLHADLLVLLLADLVLHQPALLPGRLLAQALALHLTQLLVHCLALLEWLVLVLGVPDSDVLHSAVDRPAALHQLLGHRGGRGGGGDVIWSGGTQSDQQ